MSSYYCRSISSISISKLILLVHQCHEQQHPYLKTPGLLLSRRLNIPARSCCAVCTRKFAVRLELFSTRPHRNGVYNPFLKFIANRICSTEFARILSFDWSASHLNLSSNELGDIVQTFKFRRGVGPLFEQF